MIDEKIKDIFIDNEKSNYKISNKGYVISYYNGYRKLKNNVMDSGYNIVCLYHNGKKYWKYVHRLVAEAFIDIPEKYINQGLIMKDLEVNHKNGSFEGKSDNSETNLEWCTSSENKYHAYKNNLKKQGEKHPCSKYSELQIKRVCELLESNKYGNREIWKITSVSVSTIQAILSHKQWKHISMNYDFSNHKKRHVKYSQKTIDEAIELLTNSDLSFKDIGDLIGMTRNSVWFVNKKHEIRKK